MGETIHRRDLFIGGEFLTASAAEQVTLINPATEQVVGSVPDSDELDVNRAVEAARRAFAAWRTTTPKERASYLRAFAAGYDARKEEISSLVARQNGSPHWWTVQENEHGAPNTYRLNAEIAENLTVEELVSAGGGHSLLRREPVGVVGAIVPWNSPQILLAIKLGAALAAGCTVVVKPSPETSLDTYILAEILNEVGLPPGVVNIVTGGPGTGAAVVRHPGVDKVSFTGSTAAGREIASICGQALKPVTAELGGKSAAVILDDADLDVFSAAMLQQCVPYSAQVCYSCTRILTPAARFDEVLDVVTTTLRSFNFGDPSDPDVVMGPLVSARQRARVVGYLESGVAEGARVVMGGGRAADFPVGYYIEPTVFVDVTPEMKIFREEIFGPALSVIPYQDEDECVTLHNATDYGLAGTVFSSDIDRAVEFSRRLDTGALRVNASARAVGAVHAAFKGSGLGMGGNPRIADYQLVKDISVPA